jgi:hypothetical protein
LCGKHPCGGEEDGEYQAESVHNDGQYISNSGHAMSWLMADTYL